MKRKISIFMSIVMLFSMCVMFTGCGNDEELIVGDWVCEINVTDMIKDKFLSIFDLDENAQYFDIQNLSIKMNIHFDEDGTCILEIDKGSIEKCMDDLMNQAVDGYVVMLENMHDTNLADADDLKVDIRAYFQNPIRLSAFEEIYAPWSDRRYGTELVTDYYFRDNGMLNLDCSDWGYELSKDKLLFCSSMRPETMELNLADLIDYLFVCSAPLEFKRK